MGIGESKSGKKKLVDCGDLNGYMGVLLDPLESLFELGTDDDLEETRDFHVSNVGMTLLKNIRENLQCLGDMLEEKFGNIDVMVKEDDNLKRPIKIKKI